MQQIIIIASTLHATSSNRAVVHCAPMTTLIVASSQLLDSLGATPTTEQELIPSPSDFIEGSVVHVFEQALFVCEISFEKLKLKSIAKLILLYTKKTQITK